jgi:sugar phosphate isomerase/epimerase
MPFAFLPAAGQVMDALDRYGNDEIEVCYDVANGHFIGEDPRDGLLTVSPRLGIVHVSDTGQSVYRHDAVGKGNVDFSRIPDAVAETKHKDPVVLEIISDEADGDIAASITALRRSGF